MTRTSQDRETQLRTSAFPYVGGEHLDGDSAAALALVNPATGRRIGDSAVASPDQVDQAVAVAAGAQVKWNEMGAIERGRVIASLGRLVVANAESLARADTMTMGKPLSDSEREVRGSVRACEYWSAMPERLLGEQIPTARGLLNFTIREPVGVIAAIMPWNGPAVSAVQHVASTTACGNAVVLKPSEISPLSAILVAELAEKAGMPRGLVNVVTGDGSTGERLVANPGVGAVRFTGSVSNGRKVASGAAAGLKKVVLELGGKSPSIVFADADLDRAARGSVWGVFRNAGQACIASTRLLVDRRVADQFVEMMVQRTRRIRSGDPTILGTQLGPIAYLKQYEKVQQYLASARQLGYENIAGGAGLVGETEGGYFIEPTILNKVDRSAPFVNEEIFGPVLSVLEFEDEDEAIELANSVEYGLSANVWTRDLSRALRVVDRLQAGAVVVNSARVMDPALPYEGFKSSGNANGQSYGAVEAYTRIKRASILYGDAESPGWD